VIEQRPRHFDSPRPHRQRIAKLAFLGQRNFDHFAMPALTTEVANNGSIAGLHHESASGFDFDMPAEGEPGALVYELAPLGQSEDIHWVTVTDGMLTITADPQQLRDAFGGRLAEWVDAETSTGNLSVETEHIDLRQALNDGHPLEFAVVREGDGHFVSLYYTIAGIATDKEAPPYELAPTPVGADGAEQAAVDFLDAVVDLDAERALTMLDPSEFRAAYDYWGRYSPDLVQGWQDARSAAVENGVQWELVSATTSSEDRNGRKITTFDEVVVGVTSTRADNQLDLVITVNTAGLTVTGTVEGQPVSLTITGERIQGSATLDGVVMEGELDFATYEGWIRTDGEQVTLTRDGDCLIISNGIDTQQVCDNDLPVDGAGSLLDFQTDYREALAEVGLPGLTVVERDGRWYVSGAPTLLYTAVDYLRLLDAQQLEDLLDNQPG
jgi:hypothetical protein